MLSQMIPKNLPFAILGFAARSGTGKTTLIKQLIPLLKKKGLRLGLIKHTHHTVTFDNRGLTKKVFDTGCDVVAVSAELSLAEWHQKKAETALYDAIEHYRYLPIDLLLIEGFKSAGFPKLELHRQVLEQPLLATDDQQIIAIASDNHNQVLAGTLLPVLDLNNVQAIATWIFDTLLKYDENKKENG